MSTWFDNLFVSSDAIETANEVADALARNARRKLDNGSYSQAEYDAMIAQVDDTRGANLGAGAGDQFFQTAADQGAALGKDLTTLDVGAFLRDTTRGIGGQVADPAPVAPLLSTKTAIIFAAVAVVALVVYFWALRPKR